MKNKAETICYRGYDIDIYYEQDSGNPFEEWDCCMPLMSKGGRHGFKKDYSDGEIYRFLVGMLTENQVVRHMSKICDLVGSDKAGFDLNYPKEDYTKSERVDFLRDWIHDYLLESFDHCAAYCKLFGVPYKVGTSRGYGQSDWSDVFICWTDTFGETCGLKMKDVEQEQLDAAFDLFSYWAWGDVFWYNIQDGDIGSCGGFYGDDHNKSGLLEHAKEDIENHIENVKTSRWKRLKELIKNKVPYLVRQSEIKNMEDICQQ